MDRNENWPHTQSSGVKALVFRILLLLLLLYFPNTVSGSDSQRSDAAGQFAFAESLFSESDFYRAITEYKRLLFFFPKDDLAEKAQFKIIESYYKAQRWSESVDAFSAFHTMYPRSPMMMQAKYLRGLAEKELKRYHQSLLTFREIIDAESNDYKDKAIYQTAIVLMELGEWQKSKQAFSLMPAGSPLYYSSHIMSSGIDRMDDIPQKSPMTAGVLAVVLPGAGHFYVERYKDALVAFLLNGAFIWGAVELFQHNNPVAGSIVTFFELGWYSGNIYSAVSSAHKYNKRAKNEFMRHLKDAGGISFFFNPAHSANYLMYSLIY